AGSCTGRKNFMWASRSHSHPAPLPPNGTFFGRRKAATLLDETVQPIATIAPALVAGHAKHLELAGEVADYGGAVVGA
ncbi:MAG: hypothetical protein WB041_29280, partial [Pseudolabrys sp.]